MTAKMTVEEFKKALQQEQFQDFGSSFNEQVQTSYQARVFNRLRFEPRIAKLLFVPVLLSFHFDPITGESSEQGYNYKRRYRPFVRPDDFLMNIKAVCHEDENLKKFYMDMAGYTGKWDTKPTEEFTPIDRKILFIYRRPMTGVHPAIRINSMSITGEKFGGHYLLDTVQDPLTGEYQGDISDLHKLGILSQALQRNEVNSFNTALAEQKADCISLDLGRSFITSKTFTEIKDAESVEAKTIRGLIRGCYPLGGVSPLLVTPMLGFNVTPGNGDVKQFVNKDGEEVEELLPHFRNQIEWGAHFLATDKYNVLDKINSIIGNAFPKDPSRKKARDEDADVYPNFVVMEYITDDEREVFANDQERNMAAQKMEAKKERNPLYHAKKKAWVAPEIQEFMERLAGFYEYALKDNFIKRMPELMFSGYKTANEGISERAIKIMAETFNLGDEYKQLFTPDICATHKDILMVLWPDDFAEKFDQIEDKIEEGEDKFNALLESAQDAEAPDAAGAAEEGAIGAGDPVGDIEADEVAVGA